MLYTSEYDSYFEPAMPVVELIVTNLEQSDSLTDTAIIDSGTDASLIPISKLQEINAERISWARMMGISGISHRAPIYAVNVSIGSFNIGTIRILGTREESRIILAVMFSIS